MSIDTVVAEIEQQFPPLGRHAFLDAESVKRLVHAVQPGLRCQGIVEKAPNGVWRLRVVAGVVDGRCIRRGITLPDDATAEWVREYIGKARLERRLNKAEKS